MKRCFIIVLAIFCFSQSSDAQLFKKLKDRTEQKIKQRAERKVVEGISEELARRAMKPLDNAFDEMFRQSYKDQYGKDYDDSDYAGDPQQAQRMQAQILNQMYGNVELPEKYEFSYTIEVEVTNFGEKKSEKMKMFIDPVEHAFGMQQKQKGADEQLMVFDSRNDIVVIFNENEKTAMAIPNVSKMAAVYGRQNTQEPEDRIINFNKLNKNKKILDYLCEGYEMETENSKSIFYVTDRLPFNWTDTFGNLAKSVSPNFYKENPEYNIDGMLMEGTTKDKKTNEESLWVVKKISDKNFTINCSDYTLQNMMAGR